MLKLKTNIKLDSPAFQISYKDTILALGSCFAERVAEKLKKDYYPIVSNPFGVLYNPLSIRNSLGLLLNNYEFVEKDLFQHQGIWSSFQHHSSFSGLDLEAVLKHINHELTAARTALKNTNVLLLTFGTAWVYELKETAKVVSNCHKVTAEKFVRRRLSVSKIVAELGELLAYLKQKLPQLQILMTVSPVRHLKDGFVENQISKSTLILAVEAMQQKYDFVHYFPAYEILLDDLRDYRFYDRDMVHPNALAVDYIWDLFANNYLDKKEISLRKNIQKLQRAAEHRSFFPASEGHQKFVQKQLTALQNIQKQAPYIDLEALELYFKQQEI